MNGYKELVTGIIKNRVNEWINELKEKHPETKLTRQWKVLFPKGYAEGQNVLPVVTSAKDGQQVVAEVQFILPQTLELDPDMVELVLLNKPYQETDYNTKTRNHNLPVPIDEPIEVLNELVLGINDFLIKLNITQNPAGSDNNWQLTPPNKLTGLKGQISSKNGYSSPRVMSEMSVKDDDRIEKVITAMWDSTHLPEWLKVIASHKIRNELMEKLAIGYIHYENKLKRPVDLEEFFTEYTEHLQNTGKLHNYCRYKGKAVELNDDGHCIEDWCSKKQYNTECPETVLRFGSIYN